MNSDACAMDFFHSQHVARKQTRVLVLYFCGAVVVTVLAAYLFLALLAFLFLPPLAQWYLHIFLFTIAGATGLIVAGSLYKMLRLRAGGEAVAQLLDGRLVESGSPQKAERVLVNVVQEMSIASGLAVPQVFLLDKETAINALAAGLTTADAVVIVTRGCIDQLSRDELQGVIAHEFSHILNGDMRLNLRLIGVLHGIQWIGLAGKQVFTSRFHPFQVFGMLGAVLGGILVGVGSMGMFFARMIKSAVSRQREYLADAAAVQFTRNPAGLAGALAKAAGGGSSVMNVRAEEVSHLFFADAIHRHRDWSSSRRPRKYTVLTAFHDLLATHPSPAERISRLDPSFSSTSARVRPMPRAAGEPAKSSLSHKKTDPVQSQSGRAASFPFPSAEAIARVGAPGQDDLIYAATVVSTLQTELAGVLSDPPSAVTVIYALLLDEKDEPRRMQLEALAAHADGSVCQQTKRIHSRIERLGTQMRLPLLQVVLPTLHRLSPDQYHVLLDNVHRLVQADQQISLFEFLLQRTLVQNLRPHFEKGPAPAVRYRRLRPLMACCADLLSNLAYSGHTDPKLSADAFAQAAMSLGDSDGGLQRQLRPADQCSLADVDRALEALGLASPEIKRQVLQACATCIAADGQVTLEEGELLRVIAGSLECPMPPLVAGRAVGHAVTAASASPPVVMFSGQSLADEAGTRPKESVPRARKLAVAMVISVMLLIVAGSGALFYASRAYSHGRWEIERRGGEFVDVFRYGVAGRIELGPYVSVSFAEAPLADDELRVITPYLPFLVRWSRLRLDLTEAPITDVGLAELQGAAHLYFLELGGTQVTDVGINHLAGCRNLEYLSLWSCPGITDESLKTLGQLSRMQCLELGRTSVTDDGLVHLQALDKLQRLNLTGTAVTEAGVATLRQALPGADIEY